MKMFRRQAWRRALKFSPSYQKPAFMKSYDVSGMRRRAFRAIADAAEKALWQGNIVNWRVCGTGAFVYVNGELWSEDIFQIATRFMPDKNQLAEFERIIAPLKER